ncbi:hypothetical protein [Sphingobacterium sp. E70]|uniref:hypothetical protein n=1 Tax=Sphingobacterium sp. E70 TaxID=2853439 RepID=UPI00359C652C
MAAEGRRFFDLQRWGILEPTMNAYFSVEKIGLSGWEQDVLQQVGMNIFRFLSLRLTGRKGIIHKILAISLCL